MKEEPVWLELAHFSFTTRLADMWNWITTKKFDADCFSVLQGDSLMLMKKILVGNILWGWSETAAWDSSSVFEVMYMRNNDSLFHLVTEMFR